ncbi:MAG: bifunctional oligoribonuclease/PAP phosphatase NrnA [Selenomonadaceae bacterium]|nr:bifunctional oligoribonuclease/PAP phosphatase NrnA [Selenomonadaceae bacterium]
MNISLQEAAAILQAAKRPALTAHIHPDGDALGSMLGLYHALRGLGREVRLFLDDAIPAMFSVLPGYEVIEKPPQEGEAPLADFDLLVILDTAPDRVGKTTEKILAPILNIDHHITNKGGDYPIYVDAKRAATCEIIFELLAAMPTEINRETAACLYTGIATDTGFFRYANTSPFTLRTAASLLEQGINQVAIAEAMEQKSFKTVKALATAVGKTEIWHEGRVAGIFLDRDFMAQVDTTEGFIDAIRVIDGVDIAVLLKWQEENCCRLSMRSKGADVARIAQSLGGGGHVRAAGATLNMPFSEAVAAVKKAIAEALTGEEKK